MTDQELLRWKRKYGMSEAAHIARREWIRETLTKHLVGEP